MKTITLCLMAVMFSTWTFSQTLFPYLQTVKPTSVYVTWKTSSNPQSLLQYGTSSTALTTSVNGTNQIEGICFNHWRIAENRVVTRYAALATFLAL